MKMRKRLASLMLAAVTGLFGADNALTSQEKARGWVLLFDGKTLNGWDSAVPEAASRGRGEGGFSKGAVPKQAKGSLQATAAPAIGSNPRICSTPQGRAALPAGASHWEVIDGSLAPCGDPAGYLTSKESHSNFVLTADFKTGEDTNSGVFIRSPEGTGGYEIQIWKAQPQGYNTGSIVGTAKTDREFNFIPNEWNHYEITANGDHLVVVLNGTTTLDVHDSKFADGRIRLQYQKFPIEFKNLKLLPIKQ